MSGYTFDWSWPITQPDRPLSMLVEEALDLFAEEAEAQRVQLLGEPVWSIIRGRMHVEAPAVRDRVARRHVTPVTRAGSRQTKVQVHIDDIRRWATVEHLTDRQISQRLLDDHGVTCDGSAVRKARQRNGIPPGRGNPTLAGYVPEQLGGAVAA